jgi:hypothetical protein
MSTSEGPSEHTIGAAVGAVPQPPNPAGDFVADIDPSEPLRLTARSGDTAVVFRLDRDVPLLHRLAEKAADRLERLIENWKIVTAAAVGVLALAALALTIGGAYAERPPPVTAAPPRAATPPPAPALAAPATPTVPAPPAMLHPAEARPAVAATERKPALADHSTARPLPRRTPAHAKASGPSHKATALPPKRVRKAAATVVPSAHPGARPIAPARW